MKLRYWKCRGCGETLQGVEDKDGDFVSDKELERPRKYRAVGCYLCGGIVGEFQGVVEEFEEEDYNGSIA